MKLIVDYGMGNLRSVQKACEYLGFNVAISDDPQHVKNTDGIILPGVGAFADAMSLLKRKGLDRIIIDAVKDGVPFLGICLGMQLLFEYSRENGKHKGLGILPGTVELLKCSGKVPHIGWNQVKKREDILLKGLDDNFNAYFVHSYAVNQTDKDWVAGVTEYETEFCSAVSMGNIFATQFHPEKSGVAGLKILKNFLETGA